MKFFLRHPALAAADKRPRFRASLMLAAVLAMSAGAGTASASFVQTYTSNLGFVFEFETADALANGVATQPLLLPSWSFRYVTPSASTIAFGSDSVGAMLNFHDILLSSTGQLERICVNGSLAGVGNFALNNANGLNNIITGTGCSSSVNLYEGFNLDAGFTGYMDVGVPSSNYSGLGTWAVREVTAPPPPPPPSGGNVPEPGSLLLAAAALLALRAVRGGAKAASSPAGAA